MPPPFDHVGRHFLFWLFGKNLYLWSAQRSAKLSVKGSFKKFSPCFISRLDHGLLSMAICFL